MRLRDARGVSMVEALVAMLILTIVFIAVGSVFSSLGRRADREGSRAPGIGGPTEAAVERLERDLLMAERVKRGGSARDGAFLVIELASGSRVEWALLDERLLRSESDPGADPEVEPRARLVLDRVCLLELRSRGHGLVDLALRRGDEPLRARTVLLRNADPGGGP